MNFRIDPTRLVVPLSQHDVVVSVLVGILHEKVLIRAVSGERDGGYPETGEGGLESVPSGERAGVAPCLAVGLRWPVSQRLCRAIEQENARADTYCLTHGSLRDQTDVGEAADLKVFMSKPVGLFGVYGMVVARGLAGDSSKGGRGCRVGHRGQEVECLNSPIERSMAPIPAVLIDIKENDLV